jgi:hypothetical protein
VLYISDFSSPTGAMGGVRYGTNEMGSYLHSGATCGGITSRSLSLRIYIGTGSLLSMPLLFVRCPTVSQCLYLSISLSGSVESKSAFSFSISYIAVYLAETTVFDIHSSLQ